MIMRYQIAKLFAGLGVIAILGGCSSAKPSTTATVSQNSKYSEDLTALRPKVEAVATGSDNKNPVEPDAKRAAPYVEPKYAVNKRLDTILDSIDRINVQRNFIDGFTIQVYTGMKREEALNAKKELASTLPDLQTEVQYAQPNFRVKAGKYFSRIEAQKDFNDVKKLFPAAIVIPDKVAIN